jgi:predicted permease
VVIGRLKPGVVFEQADAEVATVGRQLELTYPDAYTDGQKRNRVMLDRRVALDPLTRGIAAAVLSILMCAVAFVLVIAGANVAHLLLIRAAARARDNAVRLALGAGRVHLAGQVLIESLLLSLTGGAIGLLLGSWIVRLVPLAVNDLRFLDARFDFRMAGFTILLSVITGCLSGLIPAVLHSRSSIAATLKGGSVVGPAGPLGVRSLLVVAEVCLATIVLVGAGLLVGSARNLAAVDKGFSSDHVVLMSLDPARLGYGADRRLMLYRELFAALNGMPGVAAATVAGKPALSADFRGVYVPDGLEGDPGARFEAGGDVIAPRYFDVLKIPLVAGRDFTERDNPSAPQVAIVNEALARRLWPGENPLGKRLRMAGMGIGPPLEVIGVARDARQRRLEEAPGPFVYRPLFQLGADHVCLHVRTAGGVGGIAPAVRRFIRALDRDLAVYDVESLDDYIDGETALLRSFAAVVTAFGTVALVLATMGLYVVMSYSVAQRRREIGLRMAVGAGRADVLLLILRQSMTLVLAGLAAGVCGALALTRALQEALYGLSAADLVTYGGVSLLLTLVSLAAAYGPARTATRVDPLAVLRAE